MIDLGLEGIALLEAAGLGLDRMGTEWRAPAGSLGLAVECRSDTVVGSVTILLSR